MTETVETVGTYQTSSGTIGLAMIIIAWVLPPTARVTSEQLAYYFVLAFFVSFVGK